MAKLLLMDDQTQMENEDEEPRPSTSAAADPSTNLIDARDKNELTPLMIACYTIDYALIELLVENGSDVNATDKDGDTPIILLAIKMRSKKRPVPNQDKSPKIHKVLVPEIVNNWFSHHFILMQYYDDNIHKEAMAKYPALAAICFLLENQGKLKKANKTGRTALNILDDPIAASFLKDFYSALPDRNSSSTPSSIAGLIDSDIDADFLDDHFVASYLSSLPTSSNGQDAVAAPESSSSSSSGYCFLCADSVTDPFIFQPCGHPVMTCVNCVPKFKRCTTCNNVPTNIHINNDVYTKLIQPDMMTLQDEKGGE